MRKLLGYCAHRASVRLHEVAVGLLGPASCQRQLPAILVWVPPERNVFGEEFTPAVEIEFDDVAPRLAAAIDAVRDRVQHATWLAGIVGLERMTRRRR